VKTYLRPEMCNHPERGCPLPAVAPDLGRAEPAMRAPIVAEMVKYRDQMLPFMPGRHGADKERAFFAIFSTMTGASPGCFQHRSVKRFSPAPVISCCKFLSLRILQSSFALDRSATSASGKLAMSLTSRLRTLAGAFLTTLLWSLAASGS
jgi:hypothetical protein